MYLTLLILYKHHSGKMFNENIVIKYIFNLDIIVLHMYCLIIVDVIVDLYRNRIVCVEFGLHK